MRTEYRKGCAELDLQHDLQVYLEVLESPDGELELLRVQYEHDGALYVGRTEMWQRWLNNNEETLEIEYE